MTSTADRVRDALTTPLATLGVDLEDVEVERAGRRHVVRVVVDRDNGVDLDAVAEVSRAVSEVLDSPELTDVVPGPFVLEVTSPGVDRPLTEDRHWRRAVGRLVEVDLADGTSTTGRITQVDGDIVTLSTERGDVAVDRGAVRRAVVQVEFTRVDDDPATDVSDETAGR
jgi:ribosome maturation factor RimP